MSADPPKAESTRFQHWITEVEVSPGNTDPNSKFSARIFVDEELICNLPWIDHTRPLRWSGSLCCNVSPLSKIALRLCKSVKEKPRYFNFPPLIVSEVDEESGESTLELPEAVWVVTIKSLTSKMTEDLFPNELNKLDTIEGVYDDLDPVETVKYLFKPVLHFGKFIVEVLPGITFKVSFIIYMKAWEVMDRQKRIDDTVQGILRGIRFIGDILVTVGRASSLTLPTAVDLSKEVLADIITLLEEISVYILDRHAANDLMRKPLDENESSATSKVEAYLARLEDLKNAFYALWPTTNFSDTIKDDALDNEPLGTLWKFVQSGTDESMETEEPYEILSLLRPMDPSNYDPEQACLEGTRKVVLNKIVTWTQNRNHSESFMWISGQPGMGKTSIAASLCQQLDRINALAGSFFYNRDNADSNDPLRVINNLVHTIALKLPPYAHEVAKAIRADRGLCTSHFSLRYEGLVKRPLEKLKSLSTPTTLVVIIDALDERKNRDSSQKILNKLHEISRLVPWLRVIFTSCPERSIQEYFQKNCPHEPIFHLQDYDASEDIRAYIEDQIGELSRAESWPQGSLDQLGGTAQGVFLWAALATTYIKNSPPLALSRLRKVLDNQSSPVTDHFDSLYTAILVAAMEDNEDEMQDLYARCIATILATSNNRPLTTSSLQYLPQVIGQVDDRILEHVMKDLGPLLLTKDGQYAKFYHSSFKNYISNRSRSGKFFVPLERYDAHHSDYCLQVMQQELHFNICKLESSHLLNNEVPDLKLRVREHITPALKYACIHWIDHFIFSPNQFLVEPIKSLSEGPQLMYWIEVLSLLGRLDVATEGLPKLLLVELKGSDDWRTIVSWIKDIGRFLLTFHDVIAASTPHLYISTLAFSPVESTTAQRMRPYFPKTITVAHGGDLNWHPCIKTVLHPHAVQSFTISPDGLTVVSGYHDGSLGIWNKQTGARIREPFLGHTDSITCVVFSPKGNRVASSSNDATIRVWDVVGHLKTICVLTGHSGPVNSIAFSPSATVIASGSSDKTIRLWDPNVTRPISEPYTGHSSGVSSVAFSPDGTKLVSGSLDSTIRVWSVDLDDPKLAAHPLIITGHSDAVTCVTFSPDGTMIASGSEDKNLQIWNVQSGSKVKAHTSPAAHSDSVTSVSFSPNGKLVASSSSSGALQLWDVKTLKAFSRPFGHTSSVSNVLFLPSGSQIVSGSTDRTTRIWDISACPKAIAGASLVGHSTPILSITASSDGTRIISVSSDQNVCIWDAQTGNLIGDPYTPTSQDRITNLSRVAIAPDGSWVLFVGGNTVKLWNSTTRSIINSYQHDTVIACVAVSPDSTLVAFGCGSKACLWEVSRWKMFGASMQASESITSAVFAPDGASLATVGRSYVGLWDTKTQNRTSGPLSNLNHGGGLVALSPCGTQLASVSGSTVTVWDRKTGNYMRDVSARSTGNTALGTLTYSPAGSYLASGSRDGTIWLWDTKTGQSIGSPFAKHTAAINSTTFFPDGKYLITGSDDKSIQVWSLDPSYSGVEQTSNKSGYHCWPKNPKQLAAHPHHPGWVTHDKRSLVFWLPAHYQEPDQFLDAQMKPSRPSVFLDYKQFVHGTTWTDVVRKS